MSIGKRIKEARKLRGLSQNELAAKIGIKQPTLSELESGESQGTTRLAQLAHALGVSPLWLETGRGPQDAASSGEGEPSAGSLDLRAETAKELQLLIVYRSANEREREAIDDVVNQMRILIEARTRDQVKLVG